VLLLVFGTADQKTPLRPWRVALAIVLSLTAAAALIAGTLLGWGK
jgi:hypothetical protein